MSRWSAAIRALVPSSLTARGAVLVLLVGFAIAGPGFIGLRLHTARCDRARHEWVEALLATALAAHLSSDAAAEEEQERWLSRLGEPAKRVRWAGVFDRDGRGLEFRRQAAVTLSQVAAQIDRTATTARSTALRIDGRPSPRFVLVTIPRPAKGVILALVYEAGLPQGIGMAELGPAGLALAGLVLAWAWFELTIARPIRGLSQRVSRVGAGLAEAAVEGAPLKEMRGVVRGVGAIQRELKRWQAEATHWRHTVDARVDARTRGAASAQRTAEHEAKTDSLTGLGNRRAFEQDFPPAFERHLRSGSELALVMFDIDHFKRLNDTLGHPRGDEFLAFVGELLRAVRFAGEERAYRYGGDEFALLLPRAAPDDAVAIARRLRALFAQRAKALPSVRPLPSLSAGVAARRGHKVGTWESLLRRADEALYLAKRNQCGVATVADVLSASSSVPDGARGGLPDAPLSQGGVGG